jgi:tRNA U54 and U55 pseudouridine synthase Pus10
MNCQGIIDVTQKWLKKKPACGDKTVRAKNIQNALQGGMQLQFRMSGREDIDLGQGRA